MIIKTKRLTLKPISTDNIEAVAEILANPLINKWIENLKNKDKEYIKSALEEYYKTEGLNYYAAIYKNENARVIGIVSLEKENDDFYSIDIYLDPSVHRQGYATEVIMEGLFQYIEQQPDIKKIAARIATQNISSNSLANKLKIRAQELDVEVKICRVPLPFLTLTSDQKKYVTYGMTTFAVGLSLFCLFKYSSKISAITDRMQAFMKRNP